MRIFVTKKGGVGIISEQNLLRAPRDKIPLSCSKQKRNSIWKKSKGRTSVEFTKYSDIKIMYNIGDLIVFVMEYPLELKSMLYKFKKEHADINPIWDLNLIEDKKKILKQKRKRVINDIEFHEKQKRELKRELLILK